MFIRTESFKDFLRFYPIVSTIVALQIGIWLIGMVIPPLGDIIMYFGRGDHTLIALGEYWRFITPIFLHSQYSVGHIIFNSFALILFAPPLEQMLGRVRFILLYLLAGTLANVLTFIAIPTPYLHVGASGAVYGILGLYLFMIFFEKRFISPSDSKLILIITVISFVITFLRPNVNVLAHLFGLIAGFALGPILLKNAKPFSPWRQQSRRQSKEAIPFDPNRWKKKRYRTQTWIKPLIIGIFVLLVIIGILSSWL